MELQENCPAVIVAPTPFPDCPINTQGFVSRISGTKVEFVVLNTEGTSNTTKCLPIECVQPSSDNALKKLVDQFLKHREEMIRLSKDVEL